MKSLAKFGCLGILGLGVLIGVLVVIGIASQPKSQQHVTGEPSIKSGTNNPEPAGVGQTASLKGWELTLSDFGPYDRFSPGKPAATKAQGVLLVADLRIKNLQTSTSNFTQSDFVLKAGDGREFKAAGQTATIERGFMISQTVQPGLTTENRVVFDVDPAVKSFTFTGLGMGFAATAP